ncbi:MAG: DNA polymerase III subunit delta [Candidatus Parcubacteria bacterium]|nr:DNA polymerase III subunit delta [Candidatus Parcubacteria bacterium]
MYFIIYGPDTYRSKQKLESLRQAFMAKCDATGVNVTTIGAELLDVNYFRRLVLSAGLFGPKRLIIIERFFGKKGNDDLGGAIADFLETSADDKQGNSLIFWDEDITEKSLNKTQKVVFALLVKQKYSEEFSYLDRTQLKRWLAKVLAAGHKKITTEAADFMAQQVGPDLWQLQNEADKLIATPEEEITLELVKRFVSPSPEEEIWPLVDALAVKNKPAALKLLRDQLDLGNDLLPIFGMLVRQYRILLIVRDTLDRHGPVQSFSLAQELKLHPFVCQKAIRQVKNYTLEELKNIYQQLLNIDIKIKTTSVNPEVLLDLLIIK